MLHVRVVALARLLWAICAARDEDVITASQSQAKVVVEYLGANSIYVLASTKRQVWSMSKRLCKMAFEQPTLDFLVAERAQQPARPESANKIISIRRRWRQRRVTLDTT